MLKGHYDWFTFQPIKMQVARRSRFKIPGDTQICIDSHSLANQNRA